MHHQFYLAFPVYVWCGDSTYSSQVSVRYMRGISHSPVRFAGIDNLAELLPLHYGHGAVRLRSNLQRHLQAN